MRPQLNIDVFSPNVQNNISGHFVISTEQMEGPSICKKSRVSVFSTVTQNKQHQYPPQMMPETDVKKSNRSHCKTLTRVPSDKSSCADPISTTALPHPQTTWQPTVCLTSTWSVGFSIITQKSKWISKHTWEWKRKSGYLHCWKSVSVRITAAHKWVIPAAAYRSREPIGTCEWLISEASVKGFNMVTSPGLEQIVVRYRQAHPRECMYKNVQSVLFWDTVYDG